MRHQGSRMAAGLGLVGLLLACQAGRRPAEQPSPSGLAVVRVDNQSWADFNLFVNWETTRQRLGRATASTLGHFEVPSLLVPPAGSTLQFSLQPIGAQVAGVTRRIHVLPGDTVLITIPPR